MVYELMIYLLMKFLVTLLGFHLETPEPFDCFHFHLSEQQKQHHFQVIQDIGLIAL